MSLRWVQGQDADLDGITAIEVQCHPYPWTRVGFADSLTAGHELLLAMNDDQIVSYSVVMPVVDERHLLNITVAPPWQRKGWGAKHLQALLDRARASGAVRMLLEVRVSNIAATALYQAKGFITIGQRRHYYVSPTGTEDAFVMMCAL